MEIMRNKKIQPEGLDFLQFDFSTLPEDGRSGIQYYSQIATEPVSLPETQ